MHCFIKYMNYEDFKISSSHDSLETTTVLGNKHLIINPDCFLGIILEYIYKEVGIPVEKRALFDIASEKGKLLKVNEHAPDTNGQQIFTEKMTYYIVCCEDNQFIPVLSPSSKELEEVMTSRRKRSSLFRKYSSGRLSRGSSMGSSSDTKLKRMSS
ncbi:hypothetical protein JTB14_001938 [Gonioctena quinquepunctata]|nr:hypothetical protein JTB14_001938 [Gonioctena quinquepunctata]